MDRINNKYYYVYSSSVNEKITVKIGTLEGKPKKFESNDFLNRPTLNFCGFNQKEYPDLMVTCKIFSRNVEISLPSCTYYKSFTNRWNWNQWIKLPVSYSDIPRDAIIVFLIYDSVPEIGNQLIVGRTAISLFDQNGVYRRGIYDLRLEINEKLIEGDQNQVQFDDIDEQSDEKNCQSQMFRLTQLTRKHRDGLIPKVDWLDRLTFRKIEQVNEDEKKHSNNMFLMVEFPTVLINSIAHSVVYYEEDGDDMFQFRKQADIVRIPDTEIMQENLIERKYHILSRSLQSGILDKDLKPNSHVRDRLRKIVDYPPTAILNNDEQDLIWKFRFYLSNKKKALTKFLKCVNWKLSAQSKQALDLMNDWELIDAEDSLELLGPNFSHPNIRKYAVGRLKEASDEDLLLYLPQLVQALKYENFECVENAYKKDMLHNIMKRFKQTMETGQRSSLATRFEDEIETVSIEALDINLLANKNAISIPISIPNTIVSMTEGEKNDIIVHDANECDDLATFLIDRSSKNHTLASFFYWYLWTECETQESIEQSKNRYMYAKNLKMFLDTLSANENDRKKFRFLLNQQKFIQSLVSLHNKINRESSGRKRKIEQLQSLLANQVQSEEIDFNFANFKEPIRFPLDPQLQIHQIVAKKAMFFKSAQMPCRLSLIVSNIDDRNQELFEYVTIFKHGDDLRQDQLILQMITLIDKLWRRENLDLKLTPYKVIATSNKHGFLQYIDSITVSEALTEGSIQNYLRKYNPSSNGPFGINSEVIDTYIRSCAGYCIITFILGVGDRHLENLLLMKDGHLFHIDFGYILGDCCEGVISKNPKKVMFFLMCKIGRDPKPFPPPMKLSKEMVEAMGGQNSEFYNEFRKLCFTAFLRLRGHANLILNLFSLMTDASVPDIALEPDKAVKKIQDKLRLDLDDEAAIVYLKGLIDESVTAVMSALVDHIHKFAQYWRK